MQVRVAGVALQSGRTHLPVALWASTGGAWELLFYGTYDQVDPETIIFDRVLEADTILNFATKGKNAIGKWSPYRTTTKSDVAIVALVNNDKVPIDTSAYRQGRVESFLTQFINSNNRVTLGSKGRHLPLRTGNARYQFPRLRSPGPLHGGNVLQGIP